jgi:hypothetical protein
LNLEGVYAVVESIRKSSICFPDLSCAVNQRASSRGLPKSRTAPRDFYISEKPAGKRVARDSSS